MISSFLVQPWLAVGLSDIQPREVEIIDDPPPLLRSAALARWADVEAAWSLRRAALRREVDALDPALAWWAAWLLDALAERRAVVVGIIDDAEMSPEPRLARIEVVDREVSQRIGAIAGRAGLAAAARWLGSRLQGEDAAYGCWLLGSTRRLPSQVRRGDPIVGAEGIGIDPDGDPRRAACVELDGRIVRLVA